MEDLWGLCLFYGQRRSALSTSHVGHLSVEHIVGYVLALRALGVVEGGADSPLEAQAVLGVSCRQGGTAFPALVDAQRGGAAYVYLFYDGLCQVLVEPQNADGIRPLVGHEVEVEGVGVLWFFVHGCLIVTHRYSSQKKSQQQKKTARSFLVTFIFYFIFNSMAVGLLSNPFLFCFVFIWFRCYYIKKYFLTCVHFF